MLRPSHRGQRTTTCHVHPLFDVITFPLSRGHGSSSSCSRHRLIYESLKPIHKFLKESREKLIDHAEQVDPQLPLSRGYKNVHWQRSLCMSTYCLC